MQVTLVSRKPKGGKLVRGIANEQQMMDKLAEITQIKLDAVDLAAMPLSEQLQLITHTDLLIGEEESMAELATPDRNRSPAMALHTAPLVWHEYADK